MAKRKNKPPCECPPEGHMQGCPNDRLSSYRRRPGNDVSSRVLEAGDWADKVTRDILGKLMSGPERGKLSFEVIAQMIREAERADAMGPNLFEKLIGAVKTARLTESELEKAREALKRPHKHEVIADRPPMRVVEVTDPEELATVAREALRTAYLAAAAYRDGCHAGPCRVCDQASGQVWDRETGKGYRAELLGPCLACQGSGVQDCSVEGCKTC